jgi:hypothetical protein
MVHGEKEMNIFTCRQCDNDIPIDIFVHMGETGHTNFNQTFYEENKKCAN